MLRNVVIGSYTSEFCFASLNPSTWHTWSDSSRLHLGFSFSFSQPLCWTNRSFMSGEFELINSREHYFTVVLRCTIKALVSERLGCRRTDWFHHSDSPKGSIVCTPHPRTAQRDAWHAQVTGEVKPLSYERNCTLHSLCLFCKRRGNNWSKIMASNTPEYTALLLHSLYLCVHSRGRM